MMKSLFIISLFTFTVPFLGLANTDSRMDRDTVVIELNDKSKIIIYTKTRMDLAALENYDFNKMIRELNAQLNDSVAYLELDGEDGNYYLKEKGYSENGEIDGVKIALGSVVVEVDPEEADKLDEDDWDRRKKVSYDVERHSNRTTHHFNVDIGINNWLENGRFPSGNAPYSVKPWGSWFIGLNLFNRTWTSNTLFLEWGLGLNWYNWKLQNPNYRITKTNERVDFVIDPNQQGIKSKLTASYINIQLVPMIDFSKGRKKVTSVEASGVRIKRYSRRGVRFGIGGYAGYRLGSHSKFKYREDGETNKERENDNFFLENFRYGLRAQFGWRGIEVFTMYDLNELFSKGRGPAGSPGLNAISFGITL